MTAPIQARNDADTLPPATDHGPRTTDSASAGTTDSARAAANRLNALKSTGPRTAAGKAKSALNALKHGLTSQSPLLPTENPADYQLFSEGYLEELNPQSVDQCTLAQQLILTSWKLNRIPQIEAKVLAEIADRHPLILKWRQDCANVEYQNTTRRHPLPLPEKPAIPSTAADDLIALSFFPKPPTPGVPTSGEPAGAALHRLRQYHTNLLNTYLKLLKKYESSQNEPIQPPDDNQQQPIGNQQLAPTPVPVGSASADAALDAPVQIEPNFPDLPNLKSQISNSPASAQPTADYRLPTSPQTPSARLHAAIKSVSISSLPLNP